MPVSDQGVTHDRYMLVPRTLIFVTRDECVLLIKDAPHKRLWANKYNGLGGHIERGEDVLSAARRELLEESGLSADLRLCGTVTVDAGESVGVGIFVLRGERPAGELRSSSEGTLEWVPSEEIERLPLVEDLYTLLPRLLAMQPGDPPFAAHYAYDAAGKMMISFG